MTDSQITRIRLIVDEGKANCPVCKMAISSGFGHGCRQFESGYTSGVTYRLSDPNFPLKERAI